MTAGKHPGSAQHTQQQRSQCHLSRQDNDAQPVPIRAGWPGQLVRKEELFAPQNLLGGHRAGPKRQAPHPLYRASKRVGSLIRSAGGKGWVISHVTSGSEEEEGLDLKLRRKKEGKKAKAWVTINQPANAQKERCAVQYRCNMASGAGTCSGAAITAQQQAGQRQRLEVDCSRRVSREWGCSVVSCEWEARRTGIGCVCVCVW
jgi:hypothetical protein